MTFLPSHPHPVLNPFIHRGYRCEGKGESRGGELFTLTLIRPD